MLAFYLRIKNLFAAEEGQDLIEYALIIAVLVVIAVIGLSLVGGKVSTVWSQIAAWLSVTISGTAGS